MFISIRCAVVGLLVLIATAGMTSGAPLQSEVLLNEIMADPARDWDGDFTYNFRDDEWVEIVNVGSVAVSLDGYRLASADTTWRYEFSGLLDPGDVKVVYGSESYDWEQTFGYPAFGLRLNNSGGTLTLWRLSAQDTVRMDSYTYADHEAEDDRSTGRFPDGSPDWRVYDAYNPYNGSTEPFGTDCTPSPGTTLNCPVPVKTRTWGRIKALYGESEN